MARTARRRSRGGRQRGLTTAQRGLGWAEHQKPRQAALRELRDGDPCARCATEGRYHPMYEGLVTRRADGRLVAPLLELDDFPPRAIAMAMGITPEKKLSWARCNRRHGGRLGNQIKAVLRPPKPSQYTRW